MLWIYTKNFENCDKIIEIFRKNNLNVKLDTYFFGCATGISGSKL